MYLKYLFLLSLAVFGSRSDSSEEISDLSEADAAGFLKALIYLGYEQDKLGTISEVVQEFAESVQNISIVGWQDVVGNNGELKQTRFVTLHLPKIGNGSLLKESESDHEDANVWDDFDEVTKVFADLSSIGLPIQVSKLEYDKDGDLIERVYISHDIQYVTDEGFGYLNHTIVVHNEDEINKTIASHAHDVLDVAVIKYDSDYHLIENESKLVPELYVTIEDDDDASEELLQAVITGLGKLGVQHITETEKIPKALALYLKHELPHYAFHVTTDIDGYYISKDAYVEAVFGLTSYEIGDLHFYIFAVERSKPKN